MQVRGREVCYHRDTQHVYEIVEWEKSSRMWVLKNDLGTTVKVLANEFTLISATNEELVEAGPNGQLVTVQEMVDQNLKWVPPVFLAEKPEAAAPKPQVPKAAPAPKRATESDGTAKAKVQALLAGCTTRAEIAAIAEIPLKSSAAELLGKYQHLDNGRFRMVIGNRLRSVL